MKYFNLLAITFSDHFSILLFAFRSFSVFFFWRHEKSRNPKWRNQDGLFATEDVATSYNVIMLRTEKETVCTQKVSKEGGGDHPFPQQVRLHAAFF